jgi:putative acetyltransferase
MDLRAVPLAGASALVGAMVAEMSARYGGDGASPIAGDDFEPPDGVFLVGAVDGRDVACGGLRLLAPGVGEVKRMYVDPSVRGQGCARALLRALLDHARARGLHEVRLETGLLQPEAIGLYASEGFTPIAPYGYYKDEPLSRCFALSLG